MKKIDVIWSKILSAFNNDFYSFVNKSALARELKLRNYTTLETHLKLMQKVGLFKYPTTQNVVFAGMGDFGECVWLVENSHINQNLSVEEQIKYLENNILECKKLINNLEKIRVKGD